MSDTEDVQEKRNSKRRNLLLTLVGLTLTISAFAWGAIDLEPDPEMVRRMEASDNEKIWAVNICFEPHIEDEDFPKPGFFQGSLLAGPVLLPPETHFFIASCKEGEDACCARVELPAMRDFAMMVGGVAFWPNLHPHGSVQTYVYAASWEYDIASSNSYSTACTRMGPCNRAVIPEYDENSNRLLFVMRRSDFSYRAQGNGFLAISPEFTFEEKVN